MKARQELDTQLILARIDAFENRAGKLLRQMANYLPIIIARLPAPKDGV